MNDKVCKFAILYGSFSLYDCPGEEESPYTDMKTHRALIKRESGLELVFHPVCGFIEIMKTMPGLSADIQSNNPKERGEECRWLPQTSNTPVNVTWTRVSAKWAWSSF